MKLYGHLSQEAAEKIYDHNTAFMNNFFVLIKKHGTASLARKIFHNIPNQLSLRTLNTFLSILVKDGNVQEIESIIERMGENTDQITMGKTHTLNIFIVNLRDSFKCIRHEWKVRKFTKNSDKI